MTEDDQPPRRPTRKLDEDWEHPGEKSSGGKDSATASGSIDTAPAPGGPADLFAPAGAPPPVARVYEVPASVEPAPVPSLPAFEPPPPAPDASGLAYPAYIPPPAFPSPPAEEPILPPAYSENDLRSAVGAAPRPDLTPIPQRRPPSDDDDEDDEPRRGGRRSVVVIATSLIGGLAIAGLVILGRVNSDNYALVCEADRAVPEQGRTFPPWGTHAMAGDQWKPIKLPPEADCRRQEPDSETALETVYLAMLVDQATTMLTAREVTKVDEAEALLKQALLLARVPEGAANDVANDRHDKKTEIERLLGDVTYWRASAKLRDATTALGEAAKEFDAAAAQRPRHASDAASWATYARRLVDELHGGPAGVPAGPLPAVPVAPDHPPAPAGVALPVENKGSAAEPPTVVPPDAGAPTGGVLL